MLAGISRGLSRRLVPADSGSLPFLYCTSTIVRGYAAQKRPKEDSHVPFEGLPDPDEGEAQPTGQLEPTTMSKNERKVLKRLFKLQPPKPDPDPDPRARPSRSSHEIADDEDDMMEQILAQAVPKHLGIPSSGLLSDPSESLPSALRHDLEREARRKYERQQQARQFRARRNRSEAFHAMVRAENHRMRERIRAAETDADIWHILQTDVLDRVRALELDTAVFTEQGAATAASAPEPPPASRSASLATSPTSASAGRPLELRLMSEVLPIHLSKIQEALTNDYPSSPLGLAVVPALRAVGPAALAMGVSSDLFASYLQRLRAAHPTTLKAFTDVLSEMDREIVNFNAKVVEMLYETVVRASQARKGYTGDARRILCSTSTYREAFRTTRLWHQNIKRQTERTAISKAAKAVKEEPVAKEPGSTEPGTASDSRAQAVDQPPVKPEQAGDGSTEGRPRTSVEDASDASDFLDQGPATDRVYNV